MRPWSLRSSPLLALAIATGACRGPSAPPAGTGPPPADARSVVEAPGAAGEAPGAARLAGPRAHEVGTMRSIPATHGPILGDVPMDPLPPDPPATARPIAWPDLATPPPQARLPNVPPPVPAGLAWPGVPPWPLATVLPFPCMPGGDEPAFDPRNLVGLGLAVFDVARKQRLELPALDGIVVASQTYLLDGQRSLYFVTNEPGNLDIWKYDLPRDRIDLLPAVNTDADERAVAVSPDGRIMVYVQGPPGRGRLRRHDLTGPVAGLDGATEVPLAAAPDPHFPSVDATGDLVAYSTHVGAHQDVRLYDFRARREVTPPFLNTAANEGFPWLLPDGKAMFFVSDRGGDPEIYVVDLRDGWIEHLTDAGSPGTEFAPAYIGGTSIEFVSDRDGRYRMYLYDWVTRRLDTLPF